MTRCVGDILNNDVDDYADGGDDDLQGVDDP